jgi:hypothetical protein
MRCSFYKNRKAIVFFPLLSFSCVLLLLGCSARMEMARFPLPHVTSELENPEFWISHIEHPDSVLLTPEKIQAFNKDIASNTYLVNVLWIGETVSGERIRKVMLGDLNHHRGRTRYGHTNYPLPESFYENIELQIDTESVPEKISVSYGLTIRRTDIRAVPTHEIAMEKQNDYEFDYFQHSALGPGEPVALYHFTRDKAWVFVQAKFTHGWIRTDDIGITEDKGQLKGYVDNPALLVINGNDVPVYNDSTMTRFIGRLWMGSTAPLQRRTADGYIVLFPGRGEDGTLRLEESFISQEADISEGYLPYTQANVLRQAFKSLNEPYGWGGMFETKDCSRYVLDVFATFGIHLPRNSRSQLNAGQAIGTFSKHVSEADKLKALNLTPAGASVIGFPGHVMIYLGQHQGRHYVIHNTWAYRKKRWFVQDIKNIGKVVVSDLTLGEGSKKGSLLERLTEIRYIGL